MHINAADVRLHSIRAHEGSQARAWEELAYQLRPTVGENHFETRKTRAPDAGVEWYEVYEDGHHEGFQAKFHNKLADALGGMRESVDAVCKKRPNLTKLTFVLPYDFTDSGDSSTKTDQDRWETAVSTWKKEIPAAKNIEFRTIRGGEIVSKLTLKEHAGRREFWFGDLDLTTEWISNRFNEAKKVTNTRYTPEADSPSSINLVIDAVACGPMFAEEMYQNISNTIAACRQDKGIWGNNDSKAAKHIKALGCILEASFEKSNQGKFKFLQPSIDLENLRSDVDHLTKLLANNTEEQYGYNKQEHSQALSALAKLEQFLSSQPTKAFSEKAFALVGEAGQGKTHALMRVVDECIKRETPALAILGQRLGDNNWWAAVSELLGVISNSSDEFLQALDSQAEAKGCRALVVIDALNESQNPRRWSGELPALLAQLEKYQHLALIVSFRSDYQDVIGTPESLLTIQHPGFSGNELEALNAYCNLFEIPVPATSLFDPSLRSPLFLRMYCEIMANEPYRQSVELTRSNLFERYTKVLISKAVTKLCLPPTSKILEDAVQLVADCLLENNGNPVKRVDIESAVDRFLPGRRWPDTLFQQMFSEGLIEVRPSFDGAESVTFPFQAYSEQLLSKRLLEFIKHEISENCNIGCSNVCDENYRKELSKRIETKPWAWRSLAVILPETLEIELCDLLPDQIKDLRMQEAMRESMTDRATPAFGPRAAEILKQHLKFDSERSLIYLDTFISLSPRAGHPCNADWLHRELSGIEMAQRDATWSIASFHADRDSPAYHRLKEWAERLSAEANDEDARLASLVLMWFLTSPNRFLRDNVSKTIVKLLSNRLALAATLVRKARDTDDPYIHERILTCTYGAVLIAGDLNDYHGAHELLFSLTEWVHDGLPIDVNARDSVRGIATWYLNQGILDPNKVHEFEPPYKASPPAEPPTAESLQSDYGAIYNDDGKWMDSRAASILSSCLDWLGDFNKYVIKGDVSFFSLYPLTCSAPAEAHNDPLARVSEDWAGRWIANRAISFGWTSERFGEFESSHELNHGRDGHKVERFGKKYQWIAHRELLARLADNFHPSQSRIRNRQFSYQGPWQWYGRDFDPTLPLSSTVNGSQFCVLTEDRGAQWVSLPSPEMDLAIPASEWFVKVDDLPSRNEMFTSKDQEGRTWVALHRYSTWNRNDSQQAVTKQRERDIYFLQFAWLVPNGQGSFLWNTIKRRGLHGRWMPETERTQQQYLGEGTFSPIVKSTIPENDLDFLPAEFHEKNLYPNPAIEHYSWEGRSLDCSIDDSVDCYAPIAELLGDARWVPYKAQWELKGHVIAKAIDYPDGKHSQTVLAVELDWLKARLSALKSEMVIGTLSERSAVQPNRFDQQMVFSNITYAALLSCTSDDLEMAGPLSTSQDQHNEPLEELDPFEVKPVTEIVRYDQLYQQFE